MVTRKAPSVPVRVKYFTFDELCRAARKVQDPWVILRIKEDFLAVGSIDTNLDVSIKVVFQNGSFSPNVSRYNIHLARTFNIEILGLPALLKELQDTRWCNANLRIPSCHVELGPAIDGEICSVCVIHMEKEELRKHRPLKPTTPLASATHTALIQEVKNCRVLVKAREAELDAVKRQIERDSVAVDTEVHEGLREVIDTASIPDPFMKLFWDEQKKAMSRDPKGMRWHPMMIRFAIYLHYQSPRAYEALKRTGVLSLPNKSTLLDYTSFFKAREGFQAHVLQELKKKIEGMPEEKRFGVLMHDEMAIRGDLVYDRRGDSIVGFVNPDSWSFEDKNAERKLLASHVLVFMVVGISSDIKGSIGHFATTTATSEFLYQKLWRAVAYLEECGLKVIASTSDKASPNQRLVRLHGEELHVTDNMYASEARPIYFISDPPHLMKTLRNNLEGSRFGGRRCLWKNNKHLLWDHIVKVQNDESSGYLRKTKLRREHVNLTPASRMSVRLAVQVLSNRVGVALEDQGPEASETAKFVLLCDRFFDCLNVRSAGGDLATRKPDLAVYRSSGDERFKFLEDFLLYLNNWKAEVDRRQGFSRSEQDKMFLSPQTYEGIKTTVKGFAGATKYLLDHGVEVVFSNVFCQDPLENHFGRHRGLGHRSRNPSLYEFGHQENKLHMQRNLAFCFMPKGNVRGAQKRAVIVDEEHLPKVKRH